MITCLHGQHAHIFSTHYLSVFDNFDLGLEHTFKSKPADRFPNAFWYLRFMINGSERRYRF